MKTKSSLCIILCALSGFVVAGVARAQIITNGNFELSPIGTGVNLSAPAGGVDTTTFSDWRFFSVGGPPIQTFYGDILDATTIPATGAVAGDHVFRFYVDRSAESPSAAGADYGLDRNNAKMAVAFGTSYTFSYDAVMYGTTGGAFQFNAGLAEYDASNNFLGNQTTFSPALVTGAWTTYSFTWTPANAATTQINISFRPVTQEGFINHLALNNVSLTAVPEPGTFGLLGIAGVVGICLMRKRRGA